MPRSNNKQKTKTIIIICALILIPAIAIPLVAIEPWSTSSPFQSDAQLTAPAFTPVRVNSVDFKLYNQSRQQIYESTNSDIFHFTDDTHRYPNVDILWSQPFMSDAFGNYVNATQVVGTTPQGRILLGDKLYFYNEYYMAMDVGARTFTNMKEIGTQKAYLTPIYGTYTSPGVWGTSITANVISPPGAFIGAIDCGAIPNNANNEWPSTWGAQRAEITTLLEPMYIAVGSDPGVGDSHPLSYNNALTRLKTEWGNSFVTVLPNISLSGMSDFFQFQYERNVQLQNGSMARVRVKTTSGYVGFLNTWRDMNHETRGLVENIAPMDSGSNVVQSTAPSMERLTQLLEIEDASCDVPYENTADALGWVRYLGDYPNELITLTNDLHSHRNSLGSEVHIGLDQLGTLTLPSSISHEVGFDLRPATTIKIAKSQIKYQVVAFAIPGTPTHLDSTSLAGVDDFYYPYSIRIDNVYALTRVIMKIAIITENDAHVINVDGHPIDPALITDFNLNEVGLDPSVDDTWDALRVHVLDTRQIAQNTVTWIIIIVAIVIVISIIALVVYFKMMSGGGGGGGNIINMIGGKLK